MEKLSSLFLILLLITLSTQTLFAGICDSCDCKAISQTFFAIKPQYQSGSPEKESLFYERMDMREDGREGAFQIVLFGGRSTHREELGNYFGPFCKKCWLVKETELDPAAGDISAQHFNIATVNGDFESLISFCPRVTTFGIGLTYRQNISHLWSEREDRNFDLWIELTTPITRLETNMFLSEKITSSRDNQAIEVPDINQTFYACMSDALKQCAWCYGKIDSCCCEKVKWGLADIEFKAGLQRRLDPCRNHFYGGYIGILIPTGNKPCANYVFEPIVGHRKHWGITKGSYAKFQLWENETEDRTIYAVWYWHSAYLFPSEEMRSLDLKYKPWSRYMEVYRSKEQAQMAADFLNEERSEAARYLSTPGINVFTRCLKVKPRLYTTINSSFIFAGTKWELEAGFNFYARTAECVELECKFPCGIALKSSEGAGRTNEVRTISKNYTTCDKEIDEYESNVITACDLDLESAAHPGFISTTVYGTAGYRWNGKDYPMLLSFGASYEYGDANFVLCRWNSWLKYTFSF